MFEANEASSNVKMGILSGSVTLSATTAPGHKEFKENAWWHSAFVAK